jgi:L-ectoine synthase
MILRNLTDVKTVDWGNGVSRRFLLRADRMGYSLTDTIVHAGTKSRLEYRHHLEACYCIEGSGAVVDMSGGEHRIEPGVLYALDDHDPHFLIADPEQDMRLICVFAPALVGDERHNLDADSFSHY